MSDELIFIGEDGTGDKLWMGGKIYIWYHETEELASNLNKFIVLKSQ